MDEINQNLTNETCSGIRDIKQKLFGCVGCGGDINNNDNSLSIPTTTTDSLSSKATKSKCASQPSVA
jgi:hypothetical protein